MYHSKISIPTVECHLTIKRNRIKKYNDSFFLKSGQEFELELFNPHTESVLVKISFGGEEISPGGVILRPGERIYLERYLESDRKFKFETYEIDGSPEAKKASRLNGLVEIKTHFKDKYYLNNQINNTYPGNFIYTGDIFNINSDYPNFYGITRAYNSSYSSSNYLSSYGTGIISEGEKSNQKFHISNEKFSSFALEEMRFRILPESQKPREGADIRKYCTSCGTRVKSAGWKFCPSCGKEVK